eukprot:364493-Chlamydomonas_euryale.AAC.15
MHARHAAQQLVGTRLAETIRHRCKRGKQVEQGLEAAASPPHTHSAEGSAEGKREIVAGKREAVADSRNTATGAWGDC